MHKLVAVPVLLGFALHALAQAPPSSGPRRARPQASGLAATLTDLGAIVTQAPAIAIHPVDVELPDLTGYDLVCLTSVNGVDRPFELVRDARSLAGPTIDAIGPGTAERLREHGIAPPLASSR